jgi:hypothetical protein
MQILCCKIKVQRALNLSAKMMLLARVAMLEREIRVCVYRTLVYSGMNNRKNEDMEE